MLRPRGAKLPTQDRVEGISRDLGLLGKHIQLEALLHVNLSIKDEAIGIFSGWASTNKKNSHGFTIPLSNWERPEALTRFLSNPSINFQHDHGYLIGNAVLTELRGGGLWTDIEYERNAVLPTKLKLGDMVDRGRIRAMSCEINIQKLELIEVGGEIEILVPEAELLAIAMCGVPADPGALAMVKNELTEFVSLCLSDSKLKVGGFRMDPKMIRKALGLAEEATDEQVLERQGQLLLAADDRKKFAVSLGLKDDATNEQISLALKERDPEKIKKLEEQVKRNKAKDLVAEHKEKIAPSLLKWAENYAFTDEAGFLLYVGSAPEGGTPPEIEPIIPAPGINKPKLVGKSKTLTNDDVSVMKKFRYFTDPAKMEEMANVTPDVALGWLFPSQHFGLTTEDETTLEKRNTLDALCGIASSST